jgi:AAHS family 4-hydroxybenzoate transporter-like MFS transporter
MPNIIALTSEYAPSGMRAMLIAVMFCGFPLGSTLGGVVSAPLIGAFGWPSVFVLGGVLPLLTMVVLAFWLPESIRFLAARGVADERIARLLARVDPAVPRQAGSRYVVHGPAAVGFPVTQLFREGRARTTLLLWVAFFMNLLVMYFLVNWMPSLLRASGLPVHVAILSTAVLNLGGVVGGISLCWMVDRLNPHLVLGGAYGTSALFIAAVAMGAGELWILMPATFLAGFGVVGAQIGMNALAAAIYPTAIRSTGVGWALGVGRIGSIIGPVAGGLLRIDHRPRRRRPPAGRRLERAIGGPGWRGAGAAGGDGGRCPARPWAAAGSHIVRGDVPALTPEDGAAGSTADQASRFTRVPRPWRAAISAELRLP